jgi:hypothetical protein
LFGHLGYKYLRLTSASGDQGADILGETPDGNQIAIQTKRHASAVGNSAIQQLLGAMLFYDCAEGFLVISSDFTNGAKSLAAKEPRITLCNRAAVLDIVGKVFPERVPPFRWSDYYELFVKPGASEYSKWQVAREHFLSRDDA